MYHLWNGKPGSYSNYDCYSGKWLEIKGHLGNQNQKKSASERKDTDENIFLGLGSWKTNNANFNLHRNLTQGLQCILWLYWTFLLVPSTENKCKSLWGQVTVKGSIPFIPFLAISLSNPNTCFAEFIISSCAWNWGECCKRRAIYIFLLQIKQCLFLGIECLGATSLFGCMVWEWKGEGNLWKITLNNPFNS